MNFRDLAKKQTTLSVIMEGRTKVKTEYLINTYPDGFTIDGFDFITSKKTGEKYPVFKIAEDDKIFCNAGTILTRIFTEFVEQFKGDVDGASRELKRQGGLKVKLGVGTTAAGDTLTTVEII